MKQDRVQLPSGVIIDDYFVNLRPEIVLILPITQNQEVVFVRQYRHGVEEILMELPAGTFDPHQEKSIDAAYRELKEETGYQASTLIPLAQIYDNPVKDKTLIHIFIAPDVVSTGQQELDITEEIEVILIPLTEVKAQIFSGNIQVAGSISALMIGLEKLARSPFNFHLS
ncbi:MAG: NUDIX hydrolase [Snowella sp.]|nr:NUDIX hydrolase [Snowella sp.]